MEIMLIGDYFIVAVGILFLGLAVLSRYSFVKYKINTSLKLIDLGSSKEYLEKCYYSAYIIIPICSFASYAFSRDMAGVISCGGKSRCLESHNFSWFVFGIAVSMSSFLISRISKSMLDIYKKRELSK